MIMVMLIIVEGDGEIVSCHAACCVACGNGNETKSVWLAISLIVYFFVGLTKTFKTPLK